MLRTVLSVCLALLFSAAVFAQEARPTAPMDDTTLQSVLDQVKQKGYDLTGLIRTKQTVK